MVDVPVEIPKEIKEPRVEASEVFRKALLNEGEISTGEMNRLEDLMSRISTEELDGKLSFNNIIEFCTSCLVVTRGITIAESSLSEDTKDKLKLYVSTLGDLDTDSYFERPLPQSAKEIEVYHARFGRGRVLESFEHHLNTYFVGLVEREIFGQTDSQGNIIYSGLFQDGNLKHFDKLIELAQASLRMRRLYTSFSQEHLPILKKIIQRIELLGIKDDLLVKGPYSAQIVLSGKATQWGERPRLDYPITREEDNPYPGENPLNVMYIREGESGLFLSAINPKINDPQLEQLIVQLLKAPAVNKSNNPALKALEEWTVSQVIWREFVNNEAKVKEPTINFEEYQFARVLSGAKQASNRVEIWRHRETNRKILVKFCPEHTLQAEFVGQRFFSLIGMPVPETQIIEYSDKGKNRKVLVIGFLEGYIEEEDPFRLSDKYQFNSLILWGMLVDVWLGQYNRRPHNIMMKDGKVSFIDHGGALNSRATGGHKGFSSEIDEQTLWEVLRCIPDEDPNGDVPVNEAYGKALTIEGGKVVIKNKRAVERALKRLRMISDEQIEQVISEVGYQDGRSSIAEMRGWINSESLAGRIEKLEMKREFLDKVYSFVIQVHPTESLLAKILHCLEVTTPSDDGHTIIQEVVNQRNYQETEGSVVEILEKGEIESGKINSLKEIANYDKVREKLKARGYFDTQERLEEFMQYYLLEWIKAGWTKRDDLDYDWSQRAVKMYEQAIKKGGFKTYLIETLKQRKRNLIEFLETELDEPSN